MAIRFAHAGRVREVAILSLRPLVLAVDGRVHRVGRDPPTIDGTGFAGAVAEAGAEVMVRSDGRTLRLHPVPPPEGRAGHSAANDEIRAPMPGAVIAVHATPGKAVTAGETLIVIESMRLQTALVAPRDGILAEIAVSGGDAFDKDAVLARLSPPEETAP